MQTAHEQVESLLEQIREKSNSPAIAAITEKISMLCRGYMEPVVEDILPGVKLTPNEGSVFGLLKQRVGHAVNRGALLDAAAFHHGWDSEPMEKVVDVYVCRLRRKLKGTGFAIETVWGRGYRLVDSAPAQLPMARSHENAAARYAA